LATADVSATTTSDSFSFEQPPAALASRASNGSAAQRGRAQRSNGRWSGRDVGIQARRYPRGLRGIKAGSGSGS
jgi:hypothetical protein